MRKILAVIPARGGSKGVKQKNLRCVNGKPLIAIAIEEAKKSEFIDRLVVSTEDVDIARVSLEFGAEVPFIRPFELAMDDTPTADVIIHTLTQLKKSEGYSSDYILLLQCTSPARKAHHIDEAIRLMIQNEGQVHSVISVCEVEHSPYWMKKIDQNGLVEDFIQHDMGKYSRRQDLPGVYRLNGAIYITKTKEFLEFKDFEAGNTLPYIMDEFSSIDIDTELDFKIAEIIMKA